MYGTSNCVGTVVWLVGTVSFPGKLSLVLAPREIGGRCITVARACTCARGILLPSSICILDEGLLEL